MTKAAWRLIGSVLLGAAIAPNLTWAHDAISTKLTWTREISRIFEKRCVGCHQDGGRAPMAFGSFSAVKPWAVAIKEAILVRQMPPWPAAKGYGEFSNDFSLTQEEIVRIAEWVEGGAPEGDPAFLKPPNFAVPRWRSGSRPAGGNFEVRAGTVMPKSVSVIAVRVDRPGKLWIGAFPLVWGLRRDSQWLLLREPLRFAAGSVVEGRGTATLLLSTD